MRNYTLDKPPFPGHKIKPELAGKRLVGVKMTYLNEGVRVWWGEEFMDLHYGMKPLAASEPFPDRYGRGPYRLYYFEWKPTRQTKLV